MIYITAVAPVKIRNRINFCSHFGIRGVGKTSIIVAAPSSDSTCVFIWFHVRGGLYKYEIVTCFLGTKLGNTISFPPPGSILIYDQAASTRFARSFIPFTPQQFSEGAKREKTAKNVLDSPITTVQKMGY